MDVREKPVPASWQGPLSSWLSSLAASGRPATTMYQRRAHIAALARAIDTPPLMCTATEILDYLAGQSWQRETRRSVHASLRAFFRHIGRDDAVTELPAVRPADPMPRPAPEETYRAALAAATPRVRLMLRLAAEAGLRRGEIARVHREDLAADLIGWTLLVHGKGGKKRLVPLTDSLADAVKAAAGRGWAFPGNVDGHLAPATVGKLVSGVLPGCWTAHTLRHRFASVVHAGSGDLVAVSRLLGHASVATTQRYVATDAARLRAVAGLAAA